MGKQAYSSSVSQPSLINATKRIPTTFDHHSQCFFLPYVVVVVYLYIGYTGLHFSKNIKLQIMKILNNAITRRKKRSNGLHFSLSK